MENQFSRRVSRLFPSPFGSCRFRNVSDTVHDSISSTARNSINSDSSSFRTASSLSKPRKSSVPPENENDDKEDFPKLKSLNFRGMRVKQSLFVKNSSSSNGGWFSSEVEEDEDEEGNEVAESFFSLSSDSSCRGRTELTSAPLDSRRLPGSVTKKTRHSSRFNGETGEENKGQYREPLKYRRGRSYTTGTELGCRIFSNKASENSKQSSGFRSETGEKNMGYHRETPKPRRRSRSNSFLENPTDSFYVTSRNHRRNRKAGDRCCSVIVGNRAVESYAVMKASSDPYGDFRESMVDMIVEKEIYGIEDLQRLLEQFLCLNSSHHHGIILEVFSDICQALIAD